MTESVFLDLTHNAALLLAAALIYDLMTSRYRLEPDALTQVAIGGMLGLLGCILMISPWTYVPGIVFDSRSVLLSVAGLFFGAIPAAVAMALTAAFRLFLGGAAAWTGVAVILATGLLGIAWRHSRRQPLKGISWPELYLFGLLVHLIMLALMFTLPRETAIGVLAQISLPVMTIYPLATVLLGMLMVNRLRRESDTAEILANQERMRLFFERQIAGMAIISPAMAWLRVNDGLCRMLGYSSAEMAGLTWTELTHPDDLPAASAQFDRMLAGASDEYSMETRYIRKDGSIVWTELSVGCVRLADGSVDYILALLVDISKSKLAEESLRLFKTLVESSSDAIGMSTPAGKHFYQNQAFTNLFGDIGEEPPVTLFVDENLGKEVFKTIMAGERWDGEVKMFARDKRILSIFLRAYANKDSSGKVIGLVGVHTDISERHQAEQAIRDSEERYRTLVNNLPGLAYRCLNDNDWSMLFFSDGAERLTGYPATDFINNAVRSYASIIHPEDRATVNRYVQEGVRAHQPFEMEYRLTRADGQNIWVYEKGQGIFDARGELLWRDGVIIDITGQRQANEEKERLQAQLLQAQKIESVGRLAGGVAHDFNNMLQAILGYADLALGELDPKHPLHEYLIEIRKAAEHSASLTRQLLAFARKQTISPKVVDLNDTMASLLKMLQRLIGENVELAWLPGHDLWHIRIDPSQVDQLLANLMVNARDAIREAGKITIKTDNVKIDQAFCAAHPGITPGDYVLLMVNDDGCGMDQETLAHIFEPFFTTKDKDKGTGLGLATVYGIVKQNHGYIEVDSEPGRGATFGVYLPRFRAAKSDFIDNKTVQPEPKGGTETVLFVEDEQAILRLGTRILKRLGYTVLNAETPAEALHLAETHPGEIHLLITDMVMPGMNGWELARKLSAIRPDVKCLYISGYTADVIAKHGILEENLHFAQKPFTVSELAARVREALQ
jgi:PAS domain S-box-containing protein